MNKLFGNSPKDYLDRVYFNWYNTYVQICRPNRICWLGEVPKKIDKQDFLHIDLKDAEIVASADALPLIDGCFDLIVVANFHESSKEPVLAFKEISRALSDDGNLLIFSLVPWSHLAFSSIVQKKLTQLITFKSMRNWLRQEGIVLQKKVDVFYRPNTNFMFKQLAFLEAIGPFLAPWLASVNITMWNKLSPGMLIDGSSCESWG